MPFRPMPPPVSQKNPEKGKISPLNCHIIAIGRQRKYNVIPTLATIFPNFLFDFLLPPSILKLTGESRKNNPLNVILSRLRDKPRGPKTTASGIAIASIRFNCSGRANPDLRKGTSSWSIELLVAILESSHGLSGERLGATMRYPTSPLTCTWLAGKSQSLLLVRSSSSPIDLSRSGRAMNKSSPSCEPCG